MKKERITNMAALKPYKVREYLKKLRLNKYYEHTSHIINKLNGIPPPTIPKDVEEKLRNMFKEIQQPFMEVCPKDRNNFLSYSYVFHKFFELLGLDHLKVHFPLLKSRMKLYQQDLIWQKICNILGWQFIKSV
jgi:Poxvirus Late Transcription Factor VLTF3 like